MQIFEVIGIVGTGEGAVQGITPPGSNGLEFSPLGSIMPYEEEELAPGDDAVLQSVWTAQTNLINQQIAYLDDVKTTFAEKRAHLPVGFSMDAFVESNFFKYLAEVAVRKVIDIITDIIPGEIDDLIIDNFAEYGVKLMGAALCWLQKIYYAGSQLCERMKEENAAIAAMPASWEDFAVRSEIIKQHDLSIQSLMAQVALAENEVMQQSSVDSLDKISKNLSEFSLGEAVVQCPHTGDYIYARSGARASA